MARVLGRLSAVAVAKLKTPGYHADGGGLYLQVTATGVKTWIFRYRVDGRLRDMGLGPLNTVSLADARVKAELCRKQRLDGIDPIDARRAERAAVKAKTARAMTFRQCGEAYISAHEAAWSNPVHRTQWRNTLATYVYPVFGEHAVQVVDVGLILKVLQPIWTTKTETAKRLRARIEKILDWATAGGYRQGENPARWHGHLENLLAKPRKMQKVEHHPALPYTEIGAFLALVRAQEGIAASALEFLILTAARTGETIGARWDEIDLANKEWTIPADRIKAGKEHRVPLVPTAVALLEKVAARRVGDYVFPGGKKDNPLSNMALLKLLARMDRDDLTVHGFRSTFRDWAAERTNFPREVAEMALAHAISDKVEAAYRRGDLFEKRRKLMEAWASYCNTVRPAGEVVPLLGRGA